MRNVNYEKVTARSVQSPFLVLAKFFERYIIEI